MSYRIINGQAYPVRQLEQNFGGEIKINSTNSAGDKTKFQNVLDNVRNKDESFKVSKHAALRLKQIDFTQEDMKQIEKGFEIARNRNSKNAVMLYKDVALITSVENKTIITAVEKDRAKENIFTNIDSVVIL